MKTIPVTIETKIHNYQFKTDKPEEKEAWLKFKKKLNKAGYNRMKAISSSYAKIEEGTILLETKCLFSNQWNSDKGRVFDWYQMYVPSETYKSGHYLDITEEMIQIRKSVVVCGYCGHQELKSDNRFCTNCLDSSYLDQSKLNLLRFMSVGLHSPSRGTFDNLEPSEREWLLSSYIKAQTKRKDKVRPELIKKLESKRNSAIAKANTEVDGMIWLINNDINTDNVIYYSHTNKFSFGWRSPLSEDVEKVLTTKLEGFEFDFEIKTAS